MISRGAGSKSTREFDELQSSVDSQLNRNNCTQALNLALKALRIINPRDFSVTEDLYARRQVAKCYQKQGDFQKAIKYLSGATDSAKKFLKGQKGELAGAIQLELHNCLTNLGLAELDQFTRLTPNDCFTVPPRAFQLLDLSKAHLLESFSLTKQQLRSEHTPRDKQWFRFYCDDTLNIINIYLAEGQTFNEDHCFSKALQLINRVEKFYRQHNSEFKLKEIMSKCYFSKGVCYRFLKDYSAAERFLKKDNSYCSKHHLQEDLAKNRVEMTNLYQALNQFEKAAQYCDNPHNVSLLKSSEESFKKFQKNRSRYNPAVFDYQTYSNLIDASHEFNLQGSLISISEDMLRLHKSRLSQEQELRVHNRLAEAYWKNKDYQKSLVHVEAGRRLCNKRSKAGLALTILYLCVVTEYRTKDELNNVNMFREAIAIAESLNEKEDAATLKDNLQIYRDELTYHKMQDIEISDDEDIFQRFAPNEELDRKSCGSNRMEEEVQIVEEATSHSKQNLKRTPSARLTGEAYYQRKCLKHKLRPNGYAISNIIKRKEQELTGLANFSEKHLIVLLKTLVRPLAVDLRNHQLCNTLFQELIRQVEKKKIVLTDIQSFAVDSRISSFELLAKVLQQCVHLKQLRLLNCSVSQSFALDYELLTVLKLKACRISDDVLGSFPFSEMRALKKLSLSSNLLTCGSFQSLNSMQLLNSLNLSNNPLTDQPPTGAAYLSPVIYKLKIRDITFSSKLTDRLFDVVRGARQLDLSGCSNPLVFFEAMFNCYIRQHYELEVRALRLNKIVLADNAVNFIKSFLISAAQLQQLQLRAVKASEQALGSLVTFIDGSTNIPSVDLQQCTIPQSVSLQGSRFIV